MKLEKRKCACGCGRVFKCLPKSVAKYFSYYECNPCGAGAYAHKLEFAGKGFQPKTPRFKR